MSSSKPSMGKQRQNSLFLCECAFHDAAIAATSHHDDDDPNILNDTEKMISTARNFLSISCPEFLEVLDKHPDTKSAKDRLVKVGRNVSSTLRFERRRSSLSLSPTSPFVDDSEKEEKKTSTTPAKYTYSKEKVNASLSLVVEECSELASILSGEGTVKVPKVRFGKTELQMPIVTLGCMRFQQSWNQGKTPVLDLSQVESDCQSNLVEILKYAISSGVNHIETAQGYGSSEMQLGHALKSLFDSGYVKREDLIIQTKGGVTSSMTPEQYRKNILSSLKRLQLEYVDLFSIHGVNTEETYSWLFEREDKSQNLINTLHQLKKDGIIRHMGFSTHGDAATIQKIIESDQFEYVNLHYHFVGSYTSSGDLEYGGNLSNIRLAHSKDMGVFIISPYDKGGRLYTPSSKLRDLTLPDMEPMTYGSVWLWQHEQHDEENAPIHTIVCGGARPSDLDQPIIASIRLAKDAELITEGRENVSRRLKKAMEESVGKDWAQNWHVGVPNWKNSKYMTQHGNIVWLYNVIQAYGLLEFAKERYTPMLNNFKKYDEKKSKKENAAEMGPGFSWCPGCSIDVTRDYSVDFGNCPKENREKLLKAIAFVHELCKPDSKEETSGDNIKDEKMRLELETSYDMRPWTAFPERS